VPALDERAGQAGAVAEAAEERALADAGGGRDGVHRDVLRATLGVEPLRGVEDALAVPGGVGSLRVLHGFVYLQSDCWSVYRSQTDLRSASG
jgi:hypothetical protein